MRNSVRKYLKLFNVTDAEKYFNSEDLQWIAEMLEHKIEKDSKSTNAFGNWEESSASFDTSKPVVDLFILEKIGNTKRESIWPNKAKFAVVLSHDVDRVESYSPKSFIRNIKKRIKHADSNKTIVKLYLNLVKTHIKNWLTKKNTDPLWCYEKWLEMESKYNAKSTFFFYVKPKEGFISIYDCDYELTDKMMFNKKMMTVSDYIKYLHQNGNEIGLHGSIATHRENKLFQEQKNIIDNIIGKESTATRQHYLRYSFETTPDIHSKNNILVDSTLGLARKIGFRAGASFPYYLNTENGELLEVPLNIMDVSIFAGETSLEDAKKQVRSIVEYIESIGSCLTLNFHPDYIIIPKYVALYEYILELVSNKNCVFLNFESVKEIIEKKINEI